MAEPTHPLLLFDGVCNLCNGSVQFIIRRDPAARFRFASLQSEVGQRYLDELRIDRQAIDSMILVEGGRWSKESEAALRIHEEAESATLGGTRKLDVVGIVVGEPVAFPAAEEAVAHRRDQGVIDLQ